MDARTHEPFTIDVVSDVVCPWCYIGKRRLEAALARVGAHRARPRRRRSAGIPFQLNPDLPPEGIDRRAYLEAKFGGAARADEIYARVRTAGAEAGLSLQLDAIARQPNTRDAHRLVAWAQAQPGGDVDALVERLFAGYFVDGLFVGDRTELARLAGAAGYDAAAALDMLESDALRPEVAAAEERARRLGITGVPFFVFEGAVAVSGAHEPAALLDAIAQARSRKAVPRAAQLNLSAARSRASARARACDIADTATNSATPLAAMRNNAANSRGILS